MSRGKFRLHGLKVKPAILALVLLCIIPTLGASCKHGQKGPRPNILLITVDSMRWDYLGASGQARIETPVMDRLASEGVLFDHVIVSAPASRVSHTSLFTGLYPPQHGVRDNAMDRLSPEAVTLAELLKNAGYRTGAVVGGLPVVRNSGLDQGFDYYDDTMIDAYYENRTGQNRPLPVEIRAAQANERAISWLRDSADKKEPWFLWVHYYDPHFPYTPPSPFDLIYNDSPYAGEIAYVDANIGILLGELRRLGKQNGALVVLTADHGEALGEHQEDFSGWQAYSETIRVFAGFTWSGVIPAGKRVTETIRNIDLFASILDMAGVPIPKNSPSRSVKPFFGAGESQGKAAEQWPAAYSESLMFSQEMRWFPIYSIQEGSYHYIQMKESELYDTAHDAREANNLTTVKPEEAKRLAAVLDRIRKEIESAKGIPASSGVAEPGPKAKEFSIEQMRSIIKMRAAAYSEYRLGKFDESISLYKKVIETDPDAVQVYFSLGKIHVGQGKLDDALKYFDEFLARSSGKAKARGLVEEGAIWMEKKDPLRAEKLLKEAIKLDPDYAMAHLNLGMAYGQQELFEEAEKEFGIALKLDPRFVAAHYGLGLVLAHDPNRQIAAVQEFSEALKYEPNLALAHLSIGSILGGEGKMRDVPQAIIHLKKALEIDPNMQNREAVKKLLAELEKKN